MLKKLTLFVSLLLLCHAIIFCWGGPTHEQLAEPSLWASKWIKNAYYLSMNLYAGRHTKLEYIGKNRTVLEWLKDGEVYEDDLLGIGRSANHFHNPLKPFAGAGLSDIFTGDSLIWWSQNINKNQEDYITEGDQSWGKLNEFYYAALIEKNSCQRDEYFARMFKALGHQIHLIQDCATPDHVRNDGHPLNSIPFAKTYFGYYRCIEAWADHNLDRVGQFAYSPLMPQLDLKSSEPDVGILSPKYLLVDANKYNGLPGEASAGLDQGLAEFTNANFFSEDTIFADTLPHDDKHYFPYPAQQDITTKYSELLQNGHWGYYFKKTYGGAVVNHLLRHGYFLKLNGCDPTSIHFGNFFDDECHLDYASMLIPRAVGYSAALIDYFFRGQIEISLPTSDPGTPAPQRDGVYAFTTYPHSVFDKISLMAKNITPNEEMKNGSVKLVIRFRDPKGDPFHAGCIPDSTTQYFIVADAPSGTTSIPSDKPVRLDFDLSATPLPVGAVDVTLTIVFKGTLGTDGSNSAVAIGFKDISEATPIDYFNETDYLCFNNNYTSWLNPALLSIEDVDGNHMLNCSDSVSPGVFDNWLAVPYPITLTAISFNNIIAKTIDLSGNNNLNYYYKFEKANQIEIPPGDFFRFYVLADKGDDAISFSIAFTRGCYVDPEHVEPGCCYLVHGPGYEWNTGVHYLKSLTNELTWDYNSQAFKYDSPIFYNHRDLTYYWMEFQTHMPYPKPDPIGFTCTLPPSSRPHFIYQVVPANMQSNGLINK
jgi:hypothetical protein